MRIGASIILGLFLAIYSLLPDTSYAANDTVVQHATVAKDHQSPIRADFFVY